MIKKSYVQLCIPLLVILALIASACKKGDNDRLVDFKVFSPVKFTGYRIEDVKGVIITNVSPAYTRENSQYVFEGQLEAKKGKALFIYFTGYASGSAWMKCQKEDIPAIVRISEKETYFTIIVD